MAPRSDTHLVDHDGLVGCTRQGRDVPVDDCLGCPHLLSVAGDDRPVEIRCRAVGRDTTAVGPWAVFAGGLAPEFLAHR